MFSINVGNSRPYACQEQCFQNAVSEYIVCSGIFYRVEALLDGNF